MNVKKHEIFNRNIKWKTKDRSLIKIKDMEESHVRNTLNALIEKRVLQDIVLYELDGTPEVESREYLRDYWINIFEEEIKFREEIQGKSATEMIEHILILNGWI